jgi:glycosyltransferase involved in cell wall biosynthesis
MSWFLRQVCRQADLVISVSTYLETFLIDRFGLDRSKSLVVGNGVDDCFFVARSGTAPQHDPDRLLVVGGLNDWDGAAHVLAAADAIRAAYPMLTIDIAGTLDDARYVAAAAARPNIRRLGYVPTDQLAAAMPGYLALLYLPNVESFGMVALEAMAAGLPVIACRSTAVPETAGDAAIYVEAQSPESILAAIESLRASTATRAAWITRGHARAASFTWPACLNRLTERLTRKPPTEVGG